MGTKTLSQVTGEVGGGVHLAPHTSFWTDRALTTSTYYSATGFDATTLIEVLGLTGKWYINMLRLVNITANDLRTIKLTVDGVVVWNDTGIAVSPADPIFLGYPFTGASHLFPIGSNEYILCNDSFSLEILTAVDTSIDVLYQARPVL